VKHFRDLAISVIVSLEFLLICVAIVLTIFAPNLLTRVGSTLRANKEAFQWLSIACVGVLVFSLRWAREIMLPKDKQATILVEWPEFYIIKNRTLVGVCYIVMGTCIALATWILGLDIGASRVAAIYCGAVSIVMTSALTLWYASIQIGIRLRRVSSRRRR
jgi:hypothetical protein